MASIKALKRRLKGIKSTEKLSKAMKTVSSAKYSKISSAYAAYSKYGEKCGEVCEKFGKQLLSAFGQPNEKAPICYVVFASNRGLCGGFNTNVLNYAKDVISNSEKSVIVTCGKETQEYFSEKKIETKKNFIFKDIPESKDGKELFEYILSLRSSGEISSVIFIYPKYVNMIRQNPTSKDIFEVANPKEDDMKVLYVPNKEAVIENTARQIFESVVYKIILETALGAQAATLMAMRSAYDNAKEYAENLEKEINRMRQSEVTASVIETSVETEN